MTSKKKIVGNCLLGLISPVLSFVMMMFSQHQDSALKTCVMLQKKDMENKDAESDEEVEE
jgi:hypothetical protein